MMTKSILQAMKDEGYRFCGTGGGRLYFQRTDAAGADFRQFKTWCEVREFYDAVSARYTLSELAEIDIDLWVEGMCNLAYRHGSEIDGYKDDQEECPAEYEDEFAQFAESHGVRFDGLGRIAVEEG